MSEADDDGLGKRFICRCGKYRECNRAGNARLLKRIHEVRTGHSAVML